MLIKIKSLRRQGAKFLCFFSVFLAGNCTAAVMDVSENDYLQDLPVVLSASRLRQPISETPNAVTVIDRAMIKASGFRNIVDVFQLVPGMYVGYKDGYTPIVSYHGATDIYTRRMQVLVDGRSVYLPPFNSVDWEDLPLQLDDIERIEVVRGPAATSFGSNSILGVINITTREASEQVGATISAVHGNADNAGISDVAAHFGGGSEHLDYRLTLARRSDNGFNFPAGTPTYYNIVDDGSSTDIASMRGNYHPGGADSVDFQLGFSSGKRRTGFDGLPVRPLSPLREVSVRSGYQQLNWLRTLAGGDDLQLRYNHTSRSVEDARTTLVDPDPYAFFTLPHFISDDVSVHRHELELQHTMRTSRSNRLVWGGAYRQEYVDSGSMFPARQSVQQSRLFVHDEWHISPQLVVNGGTMMETDGFGHSHDSPRIVINYHVAPEHTVRAGVSVAYRNPGLAEERGDQHYTIPEPYRGGDWVNGLYQEFLSNGGLRPERALSREIGYLGTLGNGFSVDMRLYDDQVSDVIWIDYVLVPGSLKYLASIPAAWGFRNEFAANYTGLEGTLKYNWDQGRNRLTFSFAHQKVSCDAVGLPNLASDPIVGGLATYWFAGMVQAYSNTVPANSVSLLYQGQFDGGISASAGYYQQSSVMVLDANQPQPLNRRLDIRLAKRFGPFDGKYAGIEGGEVALVLQNVFQDSNIGYSGYILGRRAYLTATANF